MPRFCRLIDFHSTTFETCKTLVVRWDCCIIWIGWSDGWHVIPEVLGEDTLGNVDVDTQGDSGVDTPGTQV